MRLIPFTSGRPIEAYGSEGVTIAPLTQPPAVGGLTAIVIERPGLLPWR